MDWADRWFAVAGWPRPGGGAASVSWGLTLVLLVVAAQVWVRSAPSGGTSDGRVSTALRRRARGGRSGRRRGQRRGHRRGGRGPEPPPRRGDGHTLPGRQEPSQARREPSVEEVADTLLLLAVALQSGCGVVEAIEETAAVAWPTAGVELGVVAAALRWGIPDEQAWASVSPRWAAGATALSLARTAGVAPSSILLSAAEDLRGAQLASVEAAAERLGVRLVWPLGVAFLPAFVLTTVVPVVLALAQHVLVG